MLRGVFETHLDVADLERSVAFYSARLGLVVALRAELDAARGDAHSRGARRFALLWVGGHGRAMVGLWERPQRDRIRAQHVAFEVAWADLRAAVALLRERGISFRDFFQRPTTTPSVFAFMPAASLYFDDPDGHVLELVAPLPGPARPDLGILSWTDWVQIVDGAARPAHAATRDEENRVI